MLSVEEGMEVLYLRNIFNVLGICEAHPHLLIFVPTILRTPYEMTETDMNYGHLIVEAYRCSNVTLHNVNWFE